MHSSAHFISFFIFICLLFFLRQLRVGIVDFSFETPEVRRNVFSARWKERGQRGMKYGKSGFVSPQSKSPKAVRGSTAWQQLRTKQQSDVCWDSPHADWANVKLYSAQTPQDFVLCLDISIIPDRQAAAAEENPFALHQLSSGPVFQCLSQLLNFCLNYDSLEDFMQFSFSVIIIIVVPQISYSIICSSQHQITTRGITHAFCFQSQTLFHLWKETDVSIISPPPLHSIRLKSH